MKKSVLRAGIAAALLGATPAFAAPVHCEAETGPGLILISSTFDDAGWDMAVLTQQWTGFAVTQKASASSAKCTSGSAEAAMDDAYGGAIFTKSGWTPAK